MLVLEQKQNKYTECYNQLLPCFVYLTKDVILQPFLIQQYLITNNVKAAGANTDDIS